MSALLHPAAPPAHVPGVSDERLAARVPLDPTAFTELHERYEQPLLRYARSLLRDPHDAADAVQDAWVRALAALRAEPLRVLSVRSWLFAITRNACIDRMREGKRCAPAEIDERALGTTPGADDVLELRTRAREALGDLAGLSERQRTAIVLRDLRGLDGEDLARALDTDARRASWLLADARRSLAEVHDGRRLTCEATRHALETSRVRTRAVRAHIAGCPECDGFARRRVARRVHLHGIAIFVLALPARLRAALASGLDAARPVGAIAAAAVAAGVPAAHVLHPGGDRAQRAPHAAAPAPRDASAARAVVLRAATPPPRPATSGARAEASHAQRSPRSTPAVRRTAPRPVWRPAVARPATAVTGTAAAAAQGATPAIATVRRVLATVQTAAPVTAPVVRGADGLLAHL